MSGTGLDGGVSVVLPTREWTIACGDLAKQVSADDEFIVACDRPDDPVVAAAADTPATVVVETLLAPLVTVAFVTLLAGLGYAYCGIDRWAFLLTVPAYVLSLPLLCYGLAREEFVWHDRRYRWSGKFDVEVLDRSVRADEADASDGRDRGVGPEADPVD